MFKTYMRNRKSVVPFTLIDELKCNFYILAIALKKFWEKLKQYSLGR